MDPTFDPPGAHGYLTKLTGPAVSAEALGSVDAVLVSHDQHPDNLDDDGRRMALASPLILTHPGAAGRLGHGAIRGGGQCADQRTRATADADRGQGRGG